MDSDPMIIESQPVDTVGSRELVFAFGLDVSKDDFEVAMCRSDQGPFTPEMLRKVKTRKINRTKEDAEQLVEWAKSQTPQQCRRVFIMEATGCYSQQLAAWLMAAAGADFDVVVVDPCRPKGYAKSIGMRNKTDKIDARVMSAFGADRRPVSELPVGQIYIDLRAMTRTRLFLLKQVQACKNHLEMFCTEVVSQAVGKDIVKKLQSIVDACSKRIEAVEQSMKQLVAQAPELRKDVDLMVSLAGVGFLTAVSVIAEFGDLRRFRTSRQLAAMAGLNPEVCTSGKRRGETHICKRGSSFGRAALYMGAVSTIGKDCGFGRFYKHLVEDSHKHKLAAIVAVMRKMLTVMRAVVISEKPYDPQHRPNAARADKASHNPRQAQHDGDGLDPPDSACAVSPQTQPATDPTRQTTDITSQKLQPSCG